MSESQTHGAPAQRPAATQEVGLRLLLMLLLILVGLTGGVLLGMSWLFTLATARQARLDSPPAPMAQTASSLPPLPRLQVNPAQELRDIRAQEEALLQSYGWVDQSTGTVRIPIDRAMELLVTRGLPGSSEAPSGNSPGSRITP
jgi:hypothetical protein